MYCDSILLPFKCLKLSFSLAESSSFHKDGEYVFIVSNDEILEISSAKFSYKESFQTIEKHVKKMSYNSMEQYLLIERRENSERYIKRSP